jgi:predicted anti-sigma-YlaC factor YlaD
MSGEIHALSGAYAADAVNDLERVEFERHLAECSACRAEVDSLREATAVLAEQAHAAAPDSLRDSVLTRISRVRPLPPVSAEAPAGTDTWNPGARPADPARRWAPAMVAAAVLAVAGVAGVAWQPWDRAEETTQTQLTASERVLRAADAERVSLSFPDGARATVVRSRVEGQAVIRTTDMPPAPEGSVYELWLQHEDGSMSPAGLMPGKADQTVLLEGDASAAVGAGITVEPEGGSAQPTSEPIAVFEFPGTA